MWLLGVFCLQSLEAEAYIPTFNVCCPLIRLTPVHTTYRIRATSLCVRKNSLFQLPAALLSTFCPWNSAPRLIIALLTAFDHVDTRFTPLSCHVYSILDVLVVHCRHSGGKCLDLSAWVSARSFRGTHTHTHTHTNQVTSTPLSRPLLLQRVTILGKTN